MKSVNCCGNDPVITPDGSDEGSMAPGAGVLRDEDEWVTIYSGEELGSAWMARSPDGYDWTKEGLLDGSIGPQTNLLAIDNGDGTITWRMYADFGSIGCFEATVDKIGTSVTLNPAERVSSTLPARVTTGRGFAGIDATGRCTVQLYTMQGTRIAGRTLAPGSSGRFSLPAGMYLVEIESAHRLFSQKMMVK